jgi:hypothetical protein
VEPGRQFTTHSTAIPASYAPSATAHAAPPAPTPTGFQLGGWFSDPSLTTPANFAAPISADTTIFAKWTADPALATTGLSISPLVLPSALGFVLPGTPLMLVVRRRTS